MMSMGFMDLEICLFQRFFQVVVVVVDNSYIVIEIGVC